MFRDDERQGPRAQQERPMRNLSGINRMGNPLRATQQTRPTRPILRNRINHDPTKSVRVDETRRIVVEIRQRSSHAGPKIPWRQFTSFSNPELPLVNEYRSPRQQRRIPDAPRQQTRLSNPYYRGGFEQVKPSLNSFYQQPPQRQRMSSPDGSRAFPLSRRSRDDSNAIRNSIPHRDDQREAYFDDNAYYSNPAKRVRLRRAPNSPYDSFNQSSLNPRDPSFEESKMRHEAHALKQEIFNTQQQRLSEVRESELDNKNITSASAAHLSPSAIQSQVSTNNLEPGTQEILDENSIIPSEEVATIEATTNDRVINEADTFVPLPNALVPGASDDIEINVDPILLPNLEQKQFMTTDENISDYFAIKSIHVEDSLLDKGLKKPAISFLNGEFLSIKKELPLLLKKMLVSMKKLAKIHKKTDKSSAEGDDQIDHDNILVMEKFLTSTKVNSAKLFDIVKEKLSGTNFIEAIESIAEAKFIYLQAGIFQVSALLLINSKVHQNVAFMNVVEHKLETMRVLQIELEQNLSFFKIKIEPSLTSAIEEYSRATEVLKMPEGLSFSEVVIAKCMLSVMNKLYSKLKNIFINANDAFMREKFLLAEELIENYRFVSTEMNLYFEKASIFFKKRGLFK